MGATERKGADAAAAEELEGILRARSPWVESHPLADGTQMFLLGCVGLPHDDVDEAHCLRVPPMRVEAGREVDSTVAFSEEKVRALFARHLRGAPAEGGVPPHGEPRPVSGAVRQGPARARGIGAREAREPGDGVGAGVRLKARTRRRSWGSRRAPWW